MTLSVTIFAVYLQVAQMLGVYRFLVATLTWVS